MKEIMNKKLPIIIAAATLILGLGIGFFIGRKTSKVISESPIYTMEDGVYQVGVSEEADEGDEEPEESTAPVSTSAPVTTPEPTSSINGGNRSSYGGSQASSQQSGIGSETVEDQGTVESDSNTKPGGNTTYEELIKMNPEEMQALAGQFSSDQEFYNWVNTIAAEDAAAKAANDYSGDINVDETFGNE